MFHSERNIYILIPMKSNSSDNCVYDLIEFSWCFQCVLYIMFKLYININIFFFSLLILMVDSLVKKQTKCVTFRDMHRFEMLDIFQKMILWVTRKFPDLNLTRNLVAIMKKYIKMSSCPMNNNIFDSM